jgi:hypothetical protein
VVESTFTEGLVLLTLVAVCDNPQQLPPRTVSTTRRNLVTSVRRFIFI